MPNPADHSLLRFQFFAVLDLAGLMPLLRGAIATVPDALERAAMQSGFDSVQVFTRADPLLSRLAAEAGLPPAQVDAYWMQAKDLRPYYAG